LFADVPTPGGSVAGSLVLVVLGFIFLMVAAALAALTSVDWKSTEAVLTNTRLIVRAGTFRTRTACIPLGKVDKVTVRQTLVGMALDYGTVVVHQLGGRVECIRKVPHPTNFCQSLQAQIKGYNEPV
jgi:uncharacterized membrane protein YdbT with pleckstrin-like domain